GSRRPGHPERSLRRSGEAAKVRLSLDVRKSSFLSQNHWRESMDVDWSAIRVITPSQLDTFISSLKFDVVRDAGVLHCEGRTGVGSASGKFTFEPSSTFGAQLRELGYITPSSEQMFSMVM